MGPLRFSEKRLRGLPLGPPVGRKCWGGDRRIKANSARPLSSQGSAPQVGRRPAHPPPGREAPPGSNAPRTGGSLSDRWKGRWATLFSPGVILLNTPAPAPRPVPKQRGFVSLLPDEALLLQLGGGGGAAASGSFLHATASHPDARVNTHPHAGTRDEHAQA